jgi:hypothetical protein
MAYQLQTFAQTHSHNGLNHQNKINVYGVAKLQFEIKRKNHNNMELESHLSFYVY